MNWKHCHKQFDYNRLIVTIFGALFQEKVLHNVMSIFTFMGASVVRQDDSYSFEVITKTLDTVIPALIQVCPGCFKCTFCQSFVRNESMKAASAYFFSINLSLVFICLENPRRLEISLTVSRLSQILPAYENTKSYREIVFEKERIQKKSYFPAASFAIILFSRNNKPFVS